ncbi:helix-turn-helix domain-containing protein [Clostridium sp. MB40-C1]|uniref:MarR family transcriptional regulator n=1 Tax=Clostridium sp. MB40-C1 TaxID=3070996 RepID=UPI0027E1B644|nr:helix-turn-helix domain-containing protein [Clostridium sp. MB40-C1]WMJ81522.1 helix-turn-helix domain-containing protein [Clostridium sp. MB40-C1]
MELEWMRKYRNFVEKIIKFGNSYAQSYKTEYNYNTSIKFSASQLQVVEYILENEENHQNMSEIASRLGISPSAFSKNVNKMVKKGLLEKFHTSDNRKDVIIKVSD